MGSSISDGRWTLEAAPCSSKVSTGALHCYNYLLFSCNDSGNPLQLSMRFSLNAAATPGHTRASPRVRNAVMHSPTELPRMPFIDYRPR
jgi:hypothetical protein